MKLMHRPLGVRCHWVINDGRCIRELGHRGDHHHAGIVGFTGELPDDPYERGYKDGQYDRMVTYIGSAYAPWGGDGSPPVGTLVPWYSDQPCSWPGWEDIPAADGFLDHPHWVICRNGQTIFDQTGMHPWPFAVRLV